MEENKGRLSKTFKSKSESWDVKKVRCATCFKWMNGVSWDEMRDDELIFCSSRCSNEYLNAEEEDTIY